MSPLKFVIPVLVVRPVTVPSPGIVTSIDCLAPAPLYTSEKPLPLSPSHQSDVAVAAAALTANAVIIITDLRLMSAILH
jgi:hypothetical protein